MRRLLVAALCALAGVALARAAEPPPPLRIGAVGYIKSDTRLSVAPLIKYLEKGLGRPVRLTMYPGYNDAIVEIASDRLDLAILPPIVHLHVHDTLGTRPLGYGIYPTGQFSYRAVLLARKDDAAVGSLKDLKGKTIGFVDLFSASGYVYPKLMLAEAGIDAKSVKDRFFGNHLDALKALDAGQVAAAATYELVFQEAKTPIKPMSEYKVLATSDPIPSEALVATKSLDPALADTVKDLLLSFYARREEDPSYGTGLYLGFIPPDPSVLTGIRAAYHRVVPEAAQEAGR